MKQEKGGENCSPLVAVHSQDRPGYAAVKSNSEIPVDIKRFFSLIGYVFVPDWLHTVPGDPGEQKLRHVIAALSGTTGRPNHCNKGRESQEWHAGIFCTSLEVTHIISACIVLLRTHHGPT